jgi:lysophospholipase L1-like esterase
MHERIMKRAEGAPIDLLFIGDSLTEHWLVEGKEVWNTEFGAWRPGNFGLSGDTTYGVLWRLKQNEISGLHPKVVVVLIGTNDLSVGRGTEATAKAIGKVVETIKMQLPDTTVLLLGLLPRSRAADPSRKLISEVNQVISKLDNGKDIRYLDVCNSLVDKNGELIPDLMPDALHLSGKGYRVFADAIKPTILQYLTDESSK